MNIRSRSQCSHERQVGLHIIIQKHCRSVTNFTSSVAAAKSACAYHSELARRLRKAYRAGECCARAEEDPYSVWCTLMFDIVYRVEDTVSAGSETRSM